MTKIKAIGLSLLDAVWFGTYTVGPIMVFLWAIGFMVATQFVSWVLRMFG